MTEEDYDRKWDGMTAEQMQQKLEELERRETEIILAAAAA